MREKLLEPFERGDVSFRVGHGLGWLCRYLDFAGEIFAADRENDQAFHLNLWVEARSDICPWLLRRSLEDD